MLDIKFIRENKELIQDAARKKHVDFDVGELIAIDDTRRELLQTVEEKRALQNDANEKIAHATADEREQLITKMQTLKEGLQEEEEKLKDVMRHWQALMLLVPNVPDMTVPEGESDADNQQIRTWGEKPNFSFTPKSHMALAEQHDLIDFERGTKVVGFRGYFLKNEGALLSFAVWQFVLEHFSQRGGFVPVLAPSLVRREPFMGTGYIPQNEEDLYKTQDDLYLAGTAEVPVMGYYMNETLEAKDLPVRFIAFSPCFRREAGSHGKDTKGVMRVHEFFKMEQVVLCEANHETSVEWHEKLTANAEALVQALGLPYRVVVNCGGDLGLGQVKKYDIETWVPSEDTYRETHSSSYFHDFQTRRLNIRYRDADGKRRYAHSLNNTALATPRLLVALLENNQQEDGSIIIPEVLQKWMGGRKKIGN